MAATTSSVALLAPVPQGHLVSALKTCRREGKVAFGSMAWEVFRELDSLRDSQPVTVYIYPSHTSDIHFEVRWRAVYIGHVEGRGGAHPDGLRYRPETTEGDGNWAVFWEVEQLEELPSGKQIRIAALRDRRQRPYRRSFTPEGPMLIGHP